MDTTIAKDALALGRLIPRHARYRPGHAAVIAPATTARSGSTGASSTTTSNRWANALAGLGVVRGDRVATVLPNAIELVAGYWACFALGAAAVPLSMLLNPSGLASLLGDAMPRVIVSTAALRPLLDAARAAGAGADAAWVLVDASEDDERDGYRSAAKLWATRRRHLRRPTWAPTTSRRSCTRAARPASRRASATRTTSARCTHR
jgi:acyl-CoA synthetase (AMP-forming)/AMP-acid ligase II